MKSLTVFVLLVYIYVTRQTLTLDVVHNKLYINLHIASSWIKHTKIFN